MPRKKKGGLVRRNPDASIDTYREPTAITPETVREMRAGIAHIERMGGALETVKDVWGRINELSDRVEKYLSGDKATERAQTMEYFRDLRERMRGIVVTVDNERLEQKAKMDALVDRVEAVEGSTPGGALARVQELSLEVTKIAARLEEKIRALDARLTALEAGDAGLP